MNFGQFSGEIRLIYGQNLVRDFPAKAAPDAVEVRIVVSLGRVQNEVVHDWHTATKRGERIADKLRARAEVVSFYL
jgi:hypothetical protein